MIIFGSVFIVLLSAFTIFVCELIFLFDTFAWRLLFVFFSCKFTCFLFFFHVYTFVCLLFLFSIVSLFAGIQSNIAFAVFILLLSTCNFCLLAYFSVWHVCMITRLLVLFCFVLRLFVFILICLFLMIVFWLSIYFLLSAFTIFAC